MSVIAEALERELKLFEEGKLGDEEDYFLWWSYLKAIKKVKEKIREIENEVQKLQRIR